VGSNPTRYPVFGYLRQPESYHDIRDGEIFQSKLIGNNNKVTLVWHIDGAPTVKSQNIQIWLITAFIVELGISCRYSLKNIIMCGLWYGPKKPDFDLYQILFTSQLSALMKNGFNVDVNEQFVKFYVEIQTQLADLPAKSASLKMKQFNGRYGCSVCYHPGERISRDTLGWVYPYKENIRIRTYNEVWTHAHLADANGTEEFGVKGKSVILDIQRVPEETPLDYMHLVLEGKQYFLFEKNLTIL